MGSSDVVIRVEGLGKKYALHHEKTESYTSLRDVVARQAKAAGRLLNPFTLAGQLRKAQREAAHERAESEEEFWALKDVSFEIRRGERVGIIGRNGAGKSTLLKILSRITETTTGRVEICGRVASLLEVGTGFHPELTGRENVYLNGAILGMTRREIKSKFDEIVDFAEVEKFLDTPVKRYSSGMYVRLAFAVAAHLEPEILVVDEVLAVGDANFQKKCIGKMKDISDTCDKTLLFVSHQMGSISKLCSTGILMKDGQLVFQGKTDYVIQQYLDAFNGKENHASNKRQATLDHPEIHFLSVSSWSDRNQKAISFGSNEPIIVRLQLSIKEKVASTCMWFNAINQNGVKVFTSINPLWDDYIELVSGSIVSIEVKIQSGFLVPGNYTLNFAVSILHQRDIDLFDDCLNISIVDTGTDQSSHEGQDYGVVFIPCVWSNMERSGQ